MKKNNIAIMWDFDGTLIPSDSTSLTVDTLAGKPGQQKEFWTQIETLTSGEVAEGKWEHVLASHAPAWMYSLSKMAFAAKTPLDKQFFKTFVAPQVEFYPQALEMLKAIKQLSNLPEFQEQNIKIHHFIVSAGLKELIDCCFESHEDLVTWVFGCVYKVVYTDINHKDEPESVPIFCMDETMKTRSIFEIIKGSFCDKQTPVNTKVKETNEWCAFQNTIFVGDGPTDIPALSLVRSKGGVGVALYNSNDTKERVQKRLKQLSMDQRADLITAADFSLDGELYKFLKNRCYSILQRYQAKNFILNYDKN